MHIIPQQHKMLCAAIQFQLAGMVIYMIAILNQMLELKVSNTNKHISNFNVDELNKRDIIIGQHCYGCTAGSGSSCGGAVT